MAFLGNPGRRYENTRHNLARKLLESWTKVPYLSWKRQFKGETALVKGKRDVCLLIPGTYMNESGASVQKAAAFFRIPPARICVVHDDLELPYGTVGLKKGGGTAGHKGLRSVHNSLGSADFYRFRLGISRPARGSVSSYVLSRFTPEEEALLPLYLQEAAGLWEPLLQSSWEESPLLGKKRICLDALK